MKIFESTGFPKSYPQVIHKLGITFCIAIDLFCKMEYNAEKVALYLRHPQNDSKEERTMKIEQKVMDLSLAGIFTAVIFVMAAVPFLGYIPLGFMNATIIHVPVIIGALILGPRYGAWLGFVFGMTSLIRATLTPTVTSFVFSPFITIGGYRGNLWSIVIAVVPRICIGIAAYYAYHLAKRLFGKKRGGKTISFWIAGIAGSMTNTILVMNGIYLFFGESYAAASNRAAGHIYDFILGIIVAFGIPEALIAGILTAAISQAIFKILKNGS